MRLRIALKDSMTQKAYYARIPDLAPAFLVTCLLEIVPSSFVKRVHGFLKGKMDLQDLQGLR